jgi:hypothetical protein
MLGVSTALAAVVCCVFAAGASAGATLELKAGGSPLPTNAPLNLSSSQVKIVASTGIEIECEEGLGAGTLALNGAASDKGTLTQFEAKGNFDEPGGCKTASIGPVLEESKNLPWNIEFRPTGTGTVKARVDVELTVPADSNLECSYESKSLAFTFNTSGPMSVVFAKQLLTGPKGKGGGPCAGYVELSGSFSLQSGGKPVEAEVVGSASPDGSVEGFVTGAADAGVANVLVTACNVENRTSCFTATSGSHGEYTISNVPEGLYQASAAPPPGGGYGNTITEVVAVIGGTSSTLEIPLLEAGSVVVTVTDPSHATVAGVPLSLCTEETEVLAGTCKRAKTEPDGSYTFNEVPDGNSWVVTAEPVSGSGYAATDEELTVTGQAPTASSIQLREAGSVTGTVTNASSVGLAGAIVSVCEELGICEQATTGPHGEYTVEGVPVGSEVASVFPPLGYAGQTSPSLTVADNTPTTANFILVVPVGPPAGTAVEGARTTVIGGVEVPLVGWETEAPIVTQGCVGGTVTATVTGVNTESRTLETTVPVTLTEEPHLSGEFKGRLPRVYPIHGEAKTTVTVTGCSPPSDDKTSEFTLYIDPSGEVLDGDDGNAPVFDATVTLLAGETLTGPFTAVPNGSAVMSPANRTNPGLTTGAGEFGWDTIPGYYEVQASKEDCGTATTAAFRIPPPAVNLKLVLHCLLRVQTSSLPEAKLGEPYEVALAAVGAAPPFKWKKAETLPKGLKLSKTGVLSGTLSAKHLTPGTYTVAVELTDAKKRTAKATLALKVG